MINRIYLLMFIFCLPFLLSAETVLLYTISEADVVDEEQFDDLIESAVMNEFFDAGHIVFNVSVAGADPEMGLDHYKEPASMQMAKAGGAAFLLEVSLVYTDINGRNLPGYAEFRFIEVISGDTIKEGFVNLDNKWIDEGDLEDGVTAMGLSVASYALTFL
ncbi:MAG: hypothetical protein PF693_19320 [Spirochaetia bacterium]|jgi:hypothetical protein|nr:hypothetical protein [Spirochaetia bacterium]